MQTTTVSAARQGHNSSSDVPVGLAELIRGPWATPIDFFSAYVFRYESHARGPKVDLTGLTLAPQRVAYLVDRGVAVIRVIGVMTPIKTIFTRLYGGTSTRWVAQQVTAAVNDPSVSAIILAIDSPGGPVCGVPALASVVCEAAQKKPLVAHCDGTLAGAAYWIAAASNAVFVSGPAVSAGSIGLLMTKPYGLDAPSHGLHEILAGRYQPHAHNAITRRNGRIDPQDQVNYFYKFFVNAVATFRGVPPGHTATHVAEGRVFFGQQAIDAGLVDEIISLEALVSAMASDPGAFARRRRIAGCRATAASTQVSPNQTPQILNAHEHADASVAFHALQTFGLCNLVAAGSPQPQFVPAVFRRVTNPTF